MTVKRLLVLLVFTAGAACASGQSQESAAGTAAFTPIRPSDIIGLKELNDPFIAGGDLLHAIQHLRPRFLMARAASRAVNTSVGNVYVSVDGGPLMADEALTRLRPSQVLEVRFLSPVDATQQFGTPAGSRGVILVKTR